MAFAAVALLSACANAAPVSDAGGNPVSSGRTPSVSEPAAETETPSPLTTATAAVAEPSLTSAAHGSTGPAREYIGFAAEIGREVPALGAACPNLRSVTLPPEPPAEKVFVCAVEYRVVPTGGEYMFAQVRRVTSGAQQLFAAYAQASERLGNGPCSTHSLDSQMIWLHMSPIVMVPAPVDACGQPLPAAAKAYAELTTELVTEVRLHQTKSQVSIDTGCAQGSKDTLALVAKKPMPPAASKPTPITAGVKVCTYKVRVESGGFRVGDLTGGTVLDDEAAAAINAALSKLSLDGECQGKEHDAFVEVNPGVDTLFVALGGCGVLQRDVRWEGSAELRALLA